MTHTQIERPYSFVRYLGRSSAPFAQADINGNVPLWVAVHHWDRANQILLTLQSGVDPRMENNFGNSRLNMISSIKGEVTEFRAGKFDVAA